MQKSDSQTALPPLTPEQISFVMTRMRVCNQANVQKWWKAFGEAIEFTREIPIISNPFPVKEGECLMCGQQHGGLQCQMLTVK